MENEHQADASSNNRPSEDTAQNNKQEVIPAHKEISFPTVFDAIGGFVFLAVAGLLFSTGHLIWGMWCTYGAILFGVAIVACHIKIRWVWVLCGVILLAMAIWFSVWSYELMPAKVRTTKWQPPELPEDCRVVTILLGSGSGSRLDFMRDQLTKSKGRMTFGDMDAFHAYIKSNRLYVETRVPFATNEVPILMNNEMDGSIPADMDRNFNSNAFEIVDQQELPVLQVIYKRPNVVIVNGLFTKGRGDSFQMLTAFDTCLYSNHDFTILSPSFKIGEFGHTNNFIPEPPPPIKPATRKPLFKYPSSLHQSELAS